MSEADLLWECIVIRDSFFNCLIGSCCQTCQTIDYVSCGEIDTYLCILSYFLYVVCFLRLYYV